MVAPAFEEALTDIDTSIVLATCNRAPMLRSAVESLAREALAFGRPVEFVIVDDDSTDDTPTLLLDLQRTLPIPLRILQGERRGVAAARNLGCFAARGKWIASFDDDQLALPGWLTALRLMADAKAAACVGGSLTLSLPTGTALTAVGPRVRRLLGEHHLGDTPFRYEGECLPATNNVLIRRSVFHRLQGFDATFTEGAEDNDFFDRMAAAGHQLWYQPASTALHIMTPQRLAPHDLRWTSLRIGASKARVYRRRGLPIELLWLTIRLTLALLRDLPQLALATLTRNTPSALDARTSLWYTQGLLRGLAATRTTDSNFLRSMDFRTRNGERQTATRRSSEGL